MWKLHPNSLEMLCCVNAMHGGLTDEACNYRWRVARNEGRIIEADRRWRHACVRRTVSYLRSSLGKMPHCVINLKASLLIVRLLSQQPELWLVMWCSSFVPFQMAFLMRVAHTHRIYDFVEIIDSTSFFLWSEIIKCFFDLAHLSSCSEIINFMLVRIWIWCSVLYVQFIICLHVSLACCVISTLVVIGCLCVY